MRWERLLSRSRRSGRRLSRCVPGSPASTRAGCCGCTVAARGGADGGPAGARRCRRASGSPRRGSPRLRRPLARGFVARWWWPAVQREARDFLAPMPSRCCAPAGVGGAARGARAARNRDARRAGRAAGGGRRRPLRPGGPLPHTGWRRRATRRCVPGIPGSLSARRSSFPRRQQRIAARTRARTPDRPRCCRALNGAGARCGRSCCPRRSWSGAAPGGAGDLPGGARRP